jgi:hypothetical protein
MSQKKRVMSWAIQNSIVLTVTHKGRRLQVSCAHVIGTTEWALLAVEGPDGEETDVEEAINKVLDDHRHELIGKAQGLKAAMEAAEQYADKWQRAKHPNSDRCDCPDIGLDSDTETNSRVLQGGA